MSRRRGRRLLLVALALLIAGALLLLALPAGRAFLIDAVAWLRGAGPAGRASAVGLAVVAIPLGVPTLWFCALIGYLYGLPAALPLALGAVFAGAVVAFSIARWLLRDEVQALVARRPRWRAVVEAVGDEGVGLVVLLRLAGPHNLLNLVLAASTLRARDFALGTLIGSIPSVAVATAGGALAPDAGSLWQARDRLGWAWPVLLALGAAALAAAIWMTVRATRRALARIEERG
ncbi:MAG TPA: VTT domain-containing protein [Kofleriaceae bacterium]|nr:VTT domain-containing protein [Kofleriaceae bacterium]